MVAHLYGRIGGKLAQPLRAALTGSGARPIAEAWGERDELNRNLARALGNLVANALGLKEPAELYWSQLEGHGLTFTIGRGNELCVAAIKALKHLVVGKTPWPEVEQRYFEMGFDRAARRGERGEVRHRAARDEDPLGRFGVAEELPRRGRPDDVSPEM